MQTNKLLLGLAAVSSLWLSSCGNDDDSKVSLTEIKITPTTLSVTEGKTVTATATPVPADAEDVSFTWSSENTAIATAVGSGASVTVTGVAAGTTNISVTCGSITAKVPVTVTPDLALLEITVTPDTPQTLDEGQTVSLTAAPVPANSEEAASTFKWSSSDASIASVSPETGATTTVSAVKAGSATITVSNASGSIKREIQVTVNPKKVQLVGQWKFDDASDLLKATVGAPLRYGKGHPAVIPATGHNITSDAGPGAGNLSANIPLGSFLEATHNIGANGGGVYVNEYTILLDLKWTEWGQWFATYDTNIENPTGNESESWIDGYDEGSVGIDGIYSAPGAIPINTWKRLVIVVKCNSYIKYYVDGTLVNTVTDARDSGIDGRFSMDVSKVLIAASGDDYDEQMWLSEVAIYDGVLTDDEVKALGAVPVY